MRKVGVDFSNEYNSFLGYMAGLLPLLKAGQKGFELL